MEFSSADNAQTLVTSPHAQTASPPPAVPVPVAAIILAAPDTLSDRTHLSHDLQPFAGLPLIVHAVKLVRGIGASPIVIARTSSDEAKIREAVRPHVPVDELMCVNQDQEQGPLGGLRAGLSDLLEETTHALVLPATMPLLTIKALETMRAASKVAPLVLLGQAALGDGENGPVCFDVLWAEVELIRGIFQIDEGKPVVRGGSMEDLVTFAAGQRRRIATVCVSEGELLRVDTAEDLIEAEGIWRSRDGKDRGKAYGA
ncbi:uncharacterized protein MKK02DRAFT_43037 [Dioszegia hungarica]|uniref:MobA-like NTP transferase domain-containing protein n=1 Tax=Dioszegia hungarica TaxID=4972 RepID=A0AA38LXI7_9TREE|nr:uncharacterized protein MKK02DRAFT_43037 [Dioszegia hungarica]KAI9638638.1 hypothetical protein MKK02DRAFT_43037 [Dioszegia hungarica]